MIPGAQGLNADLWEMSTRLCVGDKSVHSCFLEEGVSSITVGAVEWSLWDLSYDAEDRIGKANLELMTRRRE